MNKWCLSAALTLTITGYSAAALADRHHFDVIGESYGHTREEAISFALRIADEKCYQTWGQSSQGYTVLAEWINEENGYPSARVSRGCTVDD